MSPENKPTKPAKKPEPLKLATTKVQPQPPKTPEKTATAPKSEPKPVEPSPAKATASTPTQTPTQTPVPVTLESLAAQIAEHTKLIAELQETIARKRKPVASTGKVQIKDKVTGKMYPSKNNTYKSLLKSGDLKNLVDAGIFGAVPEKNSFGWYQLNRALPGRFEEIPVTTIESK